MKTFITLVVAFVLGFLVEGERRGAKEGEL